MKYIKSYESLNQKFWKIKTTEPDFTISLQKIGLTDEQIENFYSKVNFTNIKKHDYVYVMYHIQPGQLTGRWVYSTTFINDDDKSFMGGIEITPEEYKEGLIKLDQNKYNL